MVIIHQEEVVKVAADLPRRVHGRVDVKLPPVRKGRINVRQHALLDLLRHLQLSLQPRAALTQLLLLMDHLTAAPCDLRSDHRRYGKHQ